MRLSSNYDIKVWYSSGYFIISLNAWVTEGYDYVDPFED